MKTKQLTKEEIEFLSESNKIEREYSQEALDDAIIAWKYAKKNISKRHSIKYILEIHKRLMKNLNSNLAGNIRTYPVYIGGECRTQTRIEIKVQLEAWLEHNFTRKAEQEIKEAHVAFEHIHPFGDGNGRTGRILMNIQRLAAGVPLLTIHEGQEQANYYKWFKLQGG